MADTPDQEDPAGKTQPGSTQEPPPGAPARPGAPVARPPGPIARPPTGVGARPPTRPGALPLPSNPAARSGTTGASPRPTASALPAATPVSRQTARPATAPRNPAATPAAAPRATPTATPAPAAVTPAPAAQGPAFGGAAAPSRGPASVEVPPGTLFANKYRIEKQLGKGGMGAVYLANQELLSRRVAIKLLHMSSDEVTAARFQREARVIAQCQHPNIVNLIDFGEDDGRLYLVMEYIDGRSLTDLMKAEAPFNARRVCDIGVQIAEALATAHDISVIHRDLKPDNIMVSSTAGRRDYVKILDFGVAKIKRDPGEGQANTVETKAGLIVGSLRYISPEQVESREITTRTDMYSFGCVLYEMLAGRRVFDYPSPADCAIAHLTEQPKPPVVNGVELEGPLVDFIMQCLEKKPERRPTNGRVAAQVLNACREQPLKAPPPPAELPTLALAESGGMAALQAARTLPASLPPLTQSESRPSPRPSTAASQPAAPARPPTAPTPRPPTGPDLQLRPGRPSAAEGFAIVGASDVAHTSTHLDGVRLLPRAPVPPVRKKSFAWLWILIALLVAGGVTALFAIQPWANKSAGAGTSPPTTREAQADAGASETSAEPATTVAAGADAAPSPTADPAADAAAPEEAVAAADAEPEVAAPLAGVEIVSVPDLADVTLAGKVVGKTPYTVEWGADAPPPIVRISRKGYVDVDLQLVKSDRGTQRRIELRPLDFR
ncbi:MAG: protein kinase [Deltaproteobacteria bacterium]|nr:protein kinase [Deltaproteobacteria bacterium]